MQDIENFRAETRAWLEANCPPAMRQPLTQEQIVWSGSEVKFSNDDQRVWFERMRDRGWFAPDWPADLGGGGLAPKQARIVEPTALSHHLQPVRRLQRPNQDRGAVARLTTDAVEAPVDSVRAIHVGMARRPEHRGIAQ